MKKIKIGFDGRHFLGAGGIDRYSRELLKALVQNYPECNFNLFTIRRKEELFYPLFPQSYNINIKAGFLHHFMLGNQVEPLLRHINNTYFFQKNMSHCDLYHCTNPFFYCHTTTPSVITIHDVFPFYEEEWTRNFLGKNTDRIRNIFYRGIHNSRAIITPTHTVKKELLNYIPDIKPEKVFVTHEAGNFKTLNDTSLLQQYNIKSSDTYFFHVGRFDPRKNLLGILDAFALLRDSLSQSERDSLRFVYAGKVGKEDESTFQKKTQELNLGDSFIYIHGANDTLISTLFLNAQGFVFPSYAEGFGLPVLEAMHCGCPVITSNTSCLPEIAGDAALYVNPYDTHDIAHAMNQLLHNNSLRAELQQKGYIQSAKFSWERCAKETHEVYQFALH